MTYTFLMWDKKTGKYLGIRRTSKRFPLWDENIIGNYTEGLPKKIVANPELYEYINGKLKKVKTKEEDPIEGMSIKVI